MKDIITTQTKKKDKMENTEKSARDFSSFLTKEAPGTLNTKEWAHLLTHVVSFSIYRSSNIVWRIISSVALIVTSLFVVGAFGLVDFKIASIGMAVAVLLGQLYTYLYSKSAKKLLDDTEVACKKFHGA